MGLFNSSEGKNKTIDNVPVTSSKQNDPIPVAMGQVKASQCLLWKGPVQEQKQPGQGKGGGKGDQSYLYYAPVMAGLCCGPVTSIGEMWANQTWLGTYDVADTVSITSSYSPQVYNLIIADNGVTLANTYSNTYTDYGLPTSTVLSGTDNAPMQLIPWFVSGTAYSVGQEVYYGGDVYLCKKANTSIAVSNTTYWTNEGGLTTGQYSCVPFSLGSIALSAAANASGGNTVYSASSTTLTPFSGASGGLVGFRFTVQGFPTAANNGTFLCTASSNASITLNNANGVAQTHAGTATDIAYHYHFSTADVGKSAQVFYQYNYSSIFEQDTAIIPSSAPVGGSTVNYAVQLSNQYTPTSIVSVQYWGEDNPNAGQSLTQVSSTPTAAGTFQFFSAVTVGGQNYITYVVFSSADLNEEVLITWSYVNQSAVGQTAPELINYTLFGGNMGQPVLAELESGGNWQLGGGSANVASGYEAGNPAEALGYSGIAGVGYFPMFLGSSGQTQDNSFEILTPDAYGGGITDCNPVQCISRVLTNAQWGLGSGSVPFPVSAIDNSSGGSWGGANGTPGSRQVGSTAWNWFAANNFFISPYIDGQDSAATIMSKWLEAGQCTAFMSEGLLKLVGNGSQSAANNGCTWVAPQSYVVALDDTCFIPDSEGKDPVKLTRKTYLDGYNKVHIGYSNRENQYEDDTVQEWDQASINRWGERREDPQSWNFIRTQAAATFAASMRVKDYVTLRNEYTFQVPFIYSYLEPQDVITITTSSTWAAGLNNANSAIATLPVQIKKTVDDPVKGITITAQDYIAPSKLPTIYNKSISTATGAVNQWVNPGNSEVVMFECTARMSKQTGNTIAIGACGTSSSWGGCNIWVSYDNETYKQVGTINTPARIGVLYSTLNSGSDPDTTNSIVVNMVENSGALDAGSDSDADNLTTACVVGGASSEVIGFSSLSVTGDDEYTLTSYLRRGQLGTAIASHAASSPFMVLDDSVFYYEYDPIWAGATLYFKFQSFNTFGNANQLLSSLTATTFVVPGLNPGTIDTSSGIVLNTPANTVGAGPLGWTPVATGTYGPLNGGNYGYTGMGALPSGVNSTYFYARFTGYLVPSITGEYTLGVNADDGASLYIGGQVVGSADLGNAHGMAGNLGYTQSAKILLTAGVYYPIVVEWAQSYGSYGLQLVWTPPKSSAQLITPTNLSTSNTSVTGALNGSLWNGSAGLFFPAGNGTIDPTNKTLYGPPTNGGGVNVVNAITAVTGSVNSNAFAAGNTFNYNAPGWIVGQAYMSGGTVNVAITPGNNTGYLFQINGQSGSPIAQLFRCSSFSAATYTLIGTAYAANNAAAFTGWVNFAIYIHPCGYMAIWINGNLVTDVTDVTYPVSTFNGTLYYGYQISTGKLAPSPNASAAGSTGLNQQGSVVPIQPIPSPSFTTTTTSISITWSSQTVQLSDGSSVTIGSGSKSYTGLTAGATYHLYPYIQISTLTMLFANATPPPSSINAADSAAANADGTYTVNPFTVTLPTTGTGSGGGTVTCPASTESVEVQDKGVILVSEVQAGDYIKGYSFHDKADVYRRVLSTGRESCHAWRLIDGHKVSPCEPVWYEGRCIPAYKVPGAVFDGSTGSKIMIHVDSDSYDECNYWLCGSTPLLVHNTQPIS
jgi:PA14 domain/Putative phage tail protein